MCCEIIKKRYNIVNSLISHNYNGTYISLSITLFSYFCKIIKEILKREIEIQKIEKFGNMDIFARQVVEGYMIGLHKSPYHGFSVEFAEHRLYNQGESTRYIDWKLYARTDKLFVKKYEEETNLRAQILIDTSSSMLFPHKRDFNKLIFSIYSAAVVPAGA